MVVRDASKYEFEEARSVRQGAVFRVSRLLGRPLPVLSTEARLGCQPGKEGHVITAEILFSVPNTMALLTSELMRVN